MMEVFLRRTGLTRGSLALLLMLIAFLFAIIMVLSSCGTKWLQVKDEAVVTAIEIAARRVGYYSALNNLDRAIQIVPIMEQMIAMVDTGQVDFTPILQYLGSVQDDPLLARDVADLLSLLDIQVPEIPPEKLEAVKALLRGLVEGAKMAGAAPPE